MYVHKKKLLSLYHCWLAEKSIWQTRRQQQVWHCTFISIYCHAYHNNVKIMFFFLSLYLSLSTSFELSDLFGGKLGKPIFYRLFDDFMYGHKHNRELIRVIMNLYQGFIYECWIIKYNSIVELYPLWKIAFIVELNCVVSDINELSSSENWIRLLRRMRACFLLVFTVRMIVVGLDRWCWMARPHNKKSLSSVPRPSAARVIRP